MTQASIIVPGHGVKLSPVWLEKSSDQAKCIHADSSLTTMRLHFASSLGTAAWNPLPVRIARQTDSRARVKNPRTIFMFLS